MKSNCLAAFVFGLVVGAITTIFIFNFLWPKDDDLSDKHVVNQKTVDSLMLVLNQKEWKLAILKSEAEDAQRYSDSLLKARMNEVKSDKSQKKYEKDVATYRSNSAIANERALTDWINE